MQFLHDVDVGAFESWDVDSMIWDDCSSSSDVREEHILLFNEEVLASEEVKGLKSISGS